MKILANILIFGCIFATILSIPVGNVRLKDTTELLHDSTEGITTKTHTDTDQTESTERALSFSNNDLIPSININISFPEKVTRKYVENTSKITTDVTAISTDASPGTTDLISSTTRLETESTVFTDAPTYAQTDIPTHSPTPTTQEKSKAPKCGQRFSRYPRIVGGEDSLAGEFPWTVSVRLLTTHHCGGIIINKDWILTAGHCAKRFAPRYYRIRLGGFGVDIDGFRPMYDLKVSEVVIYPKFGSPARYSYDMALLKLARSIRHREFAAPICLPTNLEETYEGRNLTVVGWGRVNDTHDDKPKDLQKVDIPVVNNSYCNQLYEDGHYAYIQVREFQICAGSKGKDSCKGDSGGPLVVLDEHERYTLVGVVSTGLGCGELNLPGIYSRVTYFVPWILQITGGYTDWPPDEEV